VSRNACFNYAARSGGCWVSFLNPTYAAGQFF
jgi:hypothetical protein